MKYLLQIFSVLSIVFFNYSLIPTYAQSLEQLITVGTQESKRTQLEDANTNTQSSSVQVIPPTASMPPVQSSIIEGSAFDQDLKNRQLRQIQNNMPDSELPLVFGERLFLGNFSEEELTSFNPGYRISHGDQLNLKMWGAFEFNQQLSVDPQGNIFIPKVGPVKVLGIPNGELNEYVEGHIRKVFNENVGVYCALVTTQPVKVFVTGFVQQPGLYTGFSSDSLLTYLDKAGGIDINRGSFIDIEIRRNAEFLRRVSLYDFLLDGNINYVQLQDGDTLLVKPRRNHIAITGEVHNAYQFEFDGSYITGNEIVRLSKPRQKANYAKVTRLSGETIDSYYVALNQLKDEKLYPDDMVEIISDKLKTTITISVTGEHDGNSRYILPANSTLADLAAELKLNERSQVQAIQLFREDLAAKQKALFNLALDNLERKVLSSPTLTTTQTEMQQQEAAQIQQFIEKARKVQPQGRVVIAGSRNFREIYLEDNDVIYIPAVTNIISINGEVNYPNTIAYQKRSVGNYVEQAGGYTDNADEKRALLIHQNGTVEEVSTRSRPAPGDEVLVMPKVKLKWFPLIKDVSEIIYNAAISARVLLLL